MQLDEKFIHMLFSKCATQGFNDNINPVRYGHTV